jgi:4-amino-4-deoxy-L-arabinose transferase-like glycosyltransferase
LATCVHFTWLAQVGRIDMPLTMTITFALGGLYLGRLENRRSWHAFAYTSIGVGLLLKGPIAAVLPGVVVAASWLLRERRFDWRSSTLWWGVPLALSIAAPWYVWANLHTNNQLWEVFFWHHNVERGLGGAEALAAHPWWFYGVRAAVDLLPWSLVVPFALYWFIRERDWRTDDGAVMGLIWFGAIAIFLSFMRFKRADYLLPAYPGFALFLGACAERWWQTRSESESEAKTSSPALACAASSVVVLCAVGWLTYGLWLVPLEERMPPYRAIAEEIRGRTQKPVIFFRAESHLLAYHLGSPVATILEWENLEIWAARPFPVYIVMPEANAREWRRHLPDGSLEEVLRTADYMHGTRDRPLVVLRSRGGS